MSLQDLAAKFQQSLQGNTLVLSDDLVGDNKVTQFLAPVLHNNVLNLQNAQIALDSSALTVTATADIISLSGVQVVLTFTQPDSGLTISLAVTESTALALGTSGLTADSLNLTLDKSGTGAVGSLSGTVVLSAVPFTVKVDKAADSWTFSASLQPANPISLTTILGALTAVKNLPDEVPDVTLASASFSVSPGDGTFSASAVSSIHFDLFGLNGFGVDSLDLEVSRAAPTTVNNQTQRSPVNMSLKLTSTSTIAVVDGLDFNGVSLTFARQDVSDWTLTGSINATVFGSQSSLTATLEQKPDIRTITLSTTTTANPLVTLGAASVTVSKLEVAIHKALGGSTSTTSGAVEISASSPYTWEVNADGSLQIGSVVSSAGSLVLYKQTNTVGLAFKPTSATLDFSLPTPLNSVSLHLNVDYLSIARKTTGATSEWDFDSSAGLWIGGLPKSIQSVGPSSADKKVTGHFKSEGGKIEIVVDRLMQPVPWTIPPASVGDLHLNLGTAVLDATNFQVTIDGSDIAGSVDFGIGIPSDVNFIFGKKSDGTPAADIFNTYTANDPNSVTRFQLTFDKTKGVEIELVTSPFKAIAFTQQGSDTFLNADLGDFGQLRALVPVFSYDGTTFTARGDFEQVDPVNHPLKVPLTPLKMLFQACHLDALASQIPDGLPIEEIAIYDTKTGKFDVDGFIGLFQKVVTTSVPAGDQSKANAVLNDVKSGLNAVASIFDKLPDTFKQYLDFVLPKSLSFDISVTTDGRFRGSVAVDKTTPIKLLYPTFSGLVPALGGITLYGFSVGEMFDGALLTVTADFIMDTFSLIDLVAAVALPLDKLPILPNSRQLSRRLIVNNLYMLVILETEIPIPVPLFYDVLGYEYLGLEGLAFHVHFSLPKPTLDLGSISHLFSNLEKFFTDHNYLLDANTPQQGVTLNFTVGSDFITLPKYLGGSTLGKPGTKYTINAYETLAHALNALKTLSLNEIVQSVPLQYRIGAEHVRFVCMDLDIAWLVTTPQEFTRLSYQQLGIASGSDANALLQVVPTNPTASTQGLIVFLRGAWRLGNSFSLMASFGLIATGSGFATGLHLNGSVSDILDIDLQGQVVIDSKASNVFSMQGQGSLSLFNKKILTGTLSIDDSHFYLNGTYNLLPDSSKVNISGSATLYIDRSGRVFFQVKQQVKIDTFVLDAANLTVDSTSGITISDTWLGQTLTLSLKYSATSPHHDAVQITAPHTDTAAGAHVDAPIPAVQQPAAHTDAPTPHVDTTAQPHADTSAVPHSDTSIFGSHADIARVHADIPMTHMDVATVHNDAVRQHVDTPAGHSDSAPVPHVDASSPLKSAIHSDVAASGTSVTLTGSIVLNIHVNVDVGKYIDVATGTDLTDHLVVNAGGNFTFEASVGTGGFSARVTGSLQWGSHTLTIPAFTITASPTSAADAANLIATQLTKNAASIIGAIYPKLSDFLKDAAAGLVTVNQQFQAMVNAAKTWSTAAWNATSQWSANAWRSAVKWDATAWNATTKWSANAWNTTTQWTDVGWNATTQWSDNAWNTTTQWTDSTWNATTHWSADTWNATTHWSASAWSATAQWSADAWSATTHWSADAWNATTTWSDSTWNNTTTWTTDVWNKSASWTADQFKNAAQTVSDYLQSLLHKHTDIPLQHGDHNYSVFGHVDVSGHYDKHGDVHGDALGISKKLFDENISIGVNHVDFTT